MSIHYTPGERFGERKQLMATGEKRGGFFAARGLGPTVLALETVSLFTDISSEMIYPLLPVFLSTVLGAGAISLGLVEGVAESTAALVKVLGGHLSDRTGRRKPLIAAGYGLAGFCRPLIGLAASWPWVLFLRFSDRVGKGIRTAPRDALIADSTDAACFGRAFGFHRSMDHLGAVMGPLIAALLIGAGLGLRAVFLLALIPSAVVMLVILTFVREGPRAPAPKKEEKETGGGTMPRGVPVLFGAIALFTLGNSTDAFILMKLSDEGVGPAWIAVLWSAHHLVKMGANYVFGSLSDKLGRKPLLAAGWLYYAAIYAGFALAGGERATIILFLAYGLYYGLTEPVEKALVADLAPRGMRGRLFGWYNGVVGVMALPASLLFGFLWRYGSAGVAFATGAVLALAAALALLFFRPRSGQVVSL